MPARKGPALEGKLNPCLTLRAKGPILISMPREKDIEKRLSILNESKRLFAAKGFHATSVSDIAEAVELPIGSIYTYFKNKDDIIQSIIEEGWEAFRESMTSAIGNEADPGKRIGLIIDVFLPELFKDVDFISIFLTEAPRVGRLREKIDFLSSLIVSQIRQIAERSGRVLEFDEKEAMAALLIFFLGSMNSVRLIHEAGLPLCEEDILRFIRSTVRNTFNLG